jgi:hypothetical protein
MDKPNRYANGKIYRLVSSIDDQFYVGSTCDTLPKRLYKHKYEAKRSPQQKIYEHFNNIGWEHVSIVLVEEFSCDNKMQLERKEREHIEAMKPTLNKIVPTRTHKEWVQANPDYDKQYQNANKDKINARRRKVRNENIEARREKEREYIEKNKEAINARSRAYKKQWRANKKAQGLKYT